MNDLDRRKFISAILASIAATQLPACDSSTTVEPTSKKRRQELPYAGIRIIEKSETLAGRLAGQLFADQGAEVLVGRDADFQPDALDEYLDRNKHCLPSAELTDTRSADIIIVDGDGDIDRSPAQIVLRVTAALPGDQTYGYLPANCSEDLINAIVGFYTDMGTTARALGRPVIYTPLPLCSVYAAVNGAIATAAALVDRVRTGIGREVTASRIAGGLSAVGAMSFTTDGLAEHHAMADAADLPEGLTGEEFTRLTTEARADASAQLLLEQRIIPLGAAYECADGAMVFIVCMINSRLADRLIEQLGIREAIDEAGFVNVTPYDPANQQYRDRNLADSVNMNYPMSTKLADLLVDAFKKKTAAEWETQMSEAGVPVGKINTFEEWLDHPDARAARVIANVAGHEKVQIGRSAWVGSAQQYPDLRACESTDSIPSRTSELPTATGKTPAKRPLEGFTIIDFANVVAGPNGVRMLAELGATVYWVCPTVPFHAPVVMIAYTSEGGVGKRSIILNSGTSEGREIMNKIVAKADMILANKTDDQMVRLGLDRESLDKLDPSIIGIQLSAWRGERPTGRQNWPGYDPIAQAFTGILERFGPKGCPTYHGIASCVDYLCGYLGAWAGLTALHARERRNDGTGDWAETSLGAAATLTQCTLPHVQLPESAIGPYATGMNEGERVYQLADGWIFAQGDHDMSEELATMTVEDGLRSLADRGVLAAPVQTCRELADRHRADISNTVVFETRPEHDGWVTENFAPTWFVFDGEPVPMPGAPVRVGSEGPAILAELGYSGEDIERLTDSGVLGRTEWEGLTD